MRISNQQIARASQVYSQQKKQVGIAKTGVSPKDDGVNLSPEARLIALALETIRQLPETDSKKLEAIEKAVESGTYEVSNEKIAEKIWQESIFDKKV